MKKLVTILLILVLVAFCAPALAANSSGTGDTVTRNGELAAFLDGNGRIYVSGLDRAVNTTPADSLVSIDPYRILFFAQANALTGVPQGRLIALTLDGFGETVVTDDAYAACLDEENVYYVSNANRGNLMRYNLDSKFSTVAFTATEALDNVYDSSIGVVAVLVDGAGAYITDPITGQFVSYAGDTAKEFAAGDGFEVYLTDTANLFVRNNGALTPALVDTNVRAWAIIGRNVYYLSGNDDALGLKQYMVDSNIWNFILTLPANMEAQLTASENSLFVLSKDNRIYSVDVAGGQLVSFATLPTPGSYALGGSRQLTGYRIEAVSGQLNLYGVVSDANAVPTFTFVDFGFPQTTEAGGSGAILLSAYAIDAESTVWDLLQPAPQFSPLRRGSRGDAVSAIQKPLYDKGYYNYYIDGIFGWRTERGVELLQDALDRPVTGVADEELQRLILSGNFPAYDPYRSLTRGDTGMRVTEMQQRLRDLGYLADDADGIFGVRTLAAVTLFQSENGLPANGIADPTTLRELFSETAHSCSSYIDLRRGDSGYRVRELNRRLKELYYLEGSVGSNYNSATVAAVRRFQQEAGMRITGEATSAVQRVLFSRNAPEYSDYITLQRGDDNDRVLEMQRRLRELGYYTKGLDGYFGAGTYKAVRLFQRQAGLRVTGIADPTTLRHLFAADAPEYQPPIEMTEPVIDIIGIFDQDEDGVRLIPAATEKLSFYWSAEGVENYDIRLDGDGKTLFSQSGITSESVDMSTDALREDILYTFTVTAHPQDKVNNKDASAKLLFRIVPEAPTLEDVTIHIDGDYTYKADEDVYEISREALLFSWTARGGEVDRYAYRIGVQGEDGAQFSEEGKDITSIDAREYELEADIVYTLSVSAYPKDNDEGVSASLNFRVIDPEELDPEPSQPEPDVPAPGELPSILLPSTFNVDTEGKADPSQEQTIGILTIEGCGGNYRYELTNNDASIIYATGEGRCETDQSVAITWNGVDANGETFSDDPDDGLMLRAWITYDDERYNDAENSEPQHEVSIIVQRAEAQPETPEDEAQEPAAIDYAFQGFTWTEGDAAEQTVATIILPKPGTIEWGIMVEGGSRDVAEDWSIRVNDLHAEAGQSVELKWNGLDADGGHASGAQNFQLSVWVNYDDGAEGEFFLDAFTVDYPVSSAPTEEIAGDEQIDEGEQPEGSAPAGDEQIDEGKQPEGSAPAGDEQIDEGEQPEGGGSASLPQPSIQILPRAEITEGGNDAPQDVLLVGEGVLSLSWPTEGDVSRYSVRITDGNGNMMIDQVLTNPGAQLSSDNLTIGMVYTLSVTANFADGETSTAEVRFMRPQVEQPADAAIIDAPADEASVDVASVDETSVDETSDDETSGDGPIDGPEAEQPINGEPALAIAPFESVSDDGTVQVGEGVLSLSWPAEGDVSNYSVRITDENGSVMIEQTLADAGAQLSSDNLSPNVVYTLSVTANFASGESSTAELRFMRPQADEPYVDEPYVDEPYVDEPYVEGPVDEPSVDEPSVAPSADGSYVEQPIIGEPALAIAPFESVSGDGTVLVSEGMLSLSWPAEGDVNSYSVRITDEYGNAVIEQELTDTGAQFASDNLTPNTVYTLSVTANFATGETSYAELRFMYPVEAETEEPYVEEPYVEEPSVEEPYVEEPSVEEPYVEGPYEEEPSVEEPYVEEPSVEEPYVEEPYVEEPSVEEPYEDEPAPEPEELYPTDDPSAWDFDVDEYSDPEAIAVIQKRLNKWGWLDSYNEGTLDEATVQAVIDFQNYLIEQGKELSVTDPEAPVIGKKTFKFLFNSKGDKYKKS